MLLMEVVGTDFLEMITTIVKHSVLFFLKDHLVLLKMFLTGP